jgi:hypothetical protein
MLSNTEQALEEKTLEEKAIENSTAQPDKWRFIAEQVMTAARENYIPNPNDITYQFSRRIAEQLLNNPEGSAGLIKESLAIGLYKGIENILTKILKK